MKFMKQCTTCKDPNHKIKMFKLKGHNHYLSIDVLGRSHTPKILIKIKEQNPETLTPQSPNSIKIPIQQQQQTQQFHCNTLTNK